MPRHFLRRLARLGTALMFLMGALDGAARVAHGVLNLPGGPHSAAWHRQDTRWFQALETRCQPLADFVRKGTSGWYVMAILRLLRNSIHGEALAGLAVSSAASAARETLVGLPRADRAEVLAAVNALGGERRWGIRRLIPDQIHCDPGVLFETLLPLVIELLNNLMEKTPVEQLSHASLQAEDLLPPVDKRPGGFPGPFYEKNRQSIRWQLGFF